jgi:hypothetical protein
VRSLIDSGAGDGFSSPTRINLSPGELRFFVTDSAEKFKRLGALFLGRPIEHITHVDLKE